MIEILGVDISCQYSHLKTLGKFEVKGGGGVLFFSTREHRCRIEVRIGVQIEGINVL